MVVAVVSNSGSSGGDSSNAIFIVCNSSSSGGDSSSGSV